MAGDDHAAFHQILSTLRGISDGVSATPRLADRLSDLIDYMISDKVRGGTPSSSVRLPKVLETKLSREEIEEYRISLSREHCAEHLTAFTAYIASLDDSIAEVVSMGCESFYSMMDEMHAKGESESYQFKLMDKADSFAGRQLLLCLDKEETRVKNFKKSLLTYTAKQRGSYNILYELLRQFMTCSTQPEVDELKTRYKNGIFMWAGQSLDEAVYGVTACIEAFKVNPYRESLPFCELTAVIAKVPGEGRSLALQQAIGSYETSILQHQLNPHAPTTLDLGSALQTIAHLWAGSSTLNTQQTYRPAALSFATPRGRYDRHRPDSAHTTVDAASGTSSGCANGCCYDIEVCETEIETAWDEYSPEALVAQIKSLICWGCGKPCPETHKLRQCNTRCPNPKCKLDFCPGNAGKPCALEGPTLTKRSVVLNAAGQPISPRMLDIMIKLQQGGDGVRPPSSGMHRGMRDAAAAAIEQFASEHGVDPTTMLHQLSANEGEIITDEESMLGGALENDQPSLEALLAVRPLSSIEASPLDANATTSLPPSQGLDIRRADDERRGTWLVGMLDSGTNCTAAKIDSCGRYARPGSICKLEGVSIGSQGVGQSTPTSMRCTLPLEFENGNSIDVDNSYDSPGSKKTLIDQNWLFYKHGLYVDMPTRSLKGFKDGSSVPLFHRGDHRLWVKFFLPVNDDSIPATSAETTFSGPQPPELESNFCEADVFDTSECASLECNGASLLTSVTALVFAARYNVSASGLDNLAAACDNLPAVKFTPELRRVIDADVHRRASITKRAAAPASSSSRPTEPGHTLCFDGKGPYETPSVIRNDIYDLLCVDAATSEPWIEGTIKHTGVEWHHFAAANVRRHRARGNEVHFLRFDRTGECTSPAFIKNIESDLKVTVQLAPSKWHEGVGGPECNNDILTRMSECMCARASLGPRYFSAARKHAAYLLRLRKKRGESKSRREMAGGTRPDLKAEKTYIFGCTVLVLREKSDRGPPGSLERGRTYEARYLGRDGAGHVVEKLDTGAICYPSHCTPLNESELVRDSMPAAGVLHSTETQTAAIPVLAPIGSNAASNVPNGQGLTVSLPFGGLNDVIDNVKERIELRYPLATVNTLDAKNDPIGDDITLRSVRVRYYNYLRANNVSTVLIATPCGSYSHCSGRRLRGKHKSEIMGLSNLSAEDTAYLKRHNLFYEFTITVLEYCDAHGIAVGIECSPDRADPTSDAFWPKFAQWGSFWDHPRVKEWIKKSGAKSYLVARCRTEEPIDVQKYYQFYFCKRLQPAADEVMTGLLCTHGSHPNVIRGKTPEGFWKSQQYEEYTPELADRVAYVCCSPILIGGLTAAPRPPFSSASRTPTPPPYTIVRDTAHATLLSEIEDALIAYDGPAADIAGIDPSTVFTIELDACATTVETTASSADTLSASELTAMVIALKVEHPSATRGELHRKLVAAGVECSLSSVKRVKVAHHVALAKAQQRAAAFDMARRLVDDERAEMERRAIGARISAAASSPVILDAAKATQNMIEVHTDVGTRFYKVPSSAAQVMKSTEMMRWIEADRIALQALLVNGNRLVRRDEVPSGCPIGHCVSARRIKVDQATGELEKFKSRHAFDSNRLAALTQRLGLPPPPTGTCNIADDLQLKMLMADIALRGRYFAKCDIGDAYLKARRTTGPQYMYMPETCAELDDDGTPMVIEFRTPIWGEKLAGDEWDCELHSRLCKIGWRQCEGCPAMYYFDKVDENGDVSDCRLVKIVDDIGFSESDPRQLITHATIDALKAAYDGQVTFDLNPSSFAGYKVNIERTGESAVVTLSQAQKVDEAMREHMPSVLDGDAKPNDVLEGTQLTALLDQLTLPSMAPTKLSTGQKTTQRIIGAIKYFERGTCPRLTRMVHRLSCVMSHPPPEALVAARSVLYHAHVHRSDALIFSAGNPARTPATADGRMYVVLSAGAPDDLEVSADASTSPHAVYSVLITYAGAAVLHKTKKIGIAVGSTHDAENVATVKASEDAIYARIILRALGVPAIGATTIITDNLSNKRVALNAHAASSSRYYLIRSVCLHQRVADGDLTVVHTPDPENPSDYLTKFIPVDKTNASVRYSMGTRRT